MTDINVTFLVFLINCRTTTNSLCMYAPNKTKQYY